jgi:hypothetical protein
VKLSNGGNLAFGFVFAVDVVNTPELMQERMARPVKNRKVNCSEVGISKVN